MAWGLNGTPDTLGVAGSVLSIADLTAFDFNVFLVHTSDITSTTDHKWRFNDNSTAVYAYGRSGNGGANTTAPSQTELLSGTQTVNKTFFDIGYCFNVDGQEKLMMDFSCFSNTTGGGFVPERGIMVGKQAITTQFTRADQISPTAGEYGINSIFLAIGTD